MSMKSLWLHVILLLVASLMLQGCSGSPGGDSINTFTGSSAPIETGDQNGPTIDVGAHPHVNQVNFSSGAAIITFSMTAHDITSGQPWDGVTYSPQEGYLQIFVKCGRKGSSGPLNWVKNWMSDNNGNFTYADGGNSYYPGSMNFALTGVLTIGDTGGGSTHYDVCLAQYGTELHNIWMCACANSTPTTFLGISGIETPDKKYIIYGAGKDYEFVLEER